MAIWIQSLSWTLICSLGQGIAVFASLWLVLKLVPATSSNVRYHLSLSGLTILFAWFAITWWSQFHALTLAEEQLAVSQRAIAAQQQMWTIGITQYYGKYSSMLSSVAYIFPWLSICYITGLMLMLVRLSAGMLQLFSLRTNGVSQPGTALDKLFISLKNKLHFEGHARLLISAKAQVPMIIGFFKPIILMPAATMAQLSTEQLETILMHELIHIKRYDYIVNILQTVVETILFFNPFVWLISANIRREREHCCDDLVLANTREPLYYATALAALAIPPGTVSSFTVAASGQTNYLFHRIKRIMEMKKHRFSYSRMAAAILIIAAITCSIAWLKPSFTDNEKDQPRKTTANTAVPVPVDSVSTYQQETTLLIQRLSADNLINEFKGFLVEKKQQKLYINGQQQTDEVAGKYLAGIKQEEIRVQVYSFQERQKMHPDAGILQLLAPASFSSPCMDTKPKKPGC